MKNFQLAILAVLLLPLVFSLGCKGTTPRAVDRNSATLTIPFPEQQTVSDDSTALSLDSLGSAVISIPDYGSLRLRKGEFLSGENDSLSLNVAFVGGFINVDLDGDGYKDAIGSLSVNTGGSGSINSLDIFLNRHGSAIHAASYEIGDREGIDSLRVNGNILDVFFRVHGPGDAMSSPSVTEEKKLQFLNGKIIELK